MSGTPIRQSLGLFPSAAGLTRAPWYSKAVPTLKPVVRESFMTDDKDTHGSGEGAA